MAGTAGGIPPTTATITATTTATGRDNPCTAPATRSIDPGIPDTAAGIVPDMAAADIALDMAVAAGIARATAAAEAIAPVTVAAAAAIAAAAAASTEGLSDSGPELSIRRGQVCGAALVVPVKTRTQCAIGCLQS